jgi:hypothetical protein
VEKAEVAVTMALVVLVVVVLEVVLLVQPTQAAEAVVMVPMVVQVLSYYLCLQLDTLAQHQVVLLLQQVAVTQY